MEKEITLTVALLGDYKPGLKGIPLSIDDAGTPDDPSDVTNFRVILGRVDITYELPEYMLEELENEFITSYED